MTKETKKFESFEDFTNLYEVQKTLRFELKPEPKTKELIGKNKVCEKGKLVDDNYHKIKYYFDLLHQKFINEALQSAKLKFNEYYNYFKLLNKSDKNSRKLFQDEETKLRKELVDEFNKIADDWKNRKYAALKLDGNGIKIFFIKESLEILKKEFPQKPNEDAPDIIFIDPPDNKGKNLFDSFKGFYTYFSNFNNSRRNFYSSKDKDTSIANRTINENLRRFCENRKQFLERKEIYKKAGLTEDEKKIFELDYYNKCLAQEGIKNYNRFIGGETKENGEKIQGINEKINLYRQKTKEKVPLFKELYKQILGEKERAERFIEITSDDKVFDLLREFIALNDSKNNQAKKLFIEEFLSNQKNYELDKIYLKKAAINTISRKFFGERWQYFENALPHKETSSKEEKYKLDDFISIQQIKDVLCGTQPELPKKWKYSGKIETKEPVNLYGEKYKDILVKNNESEANYKSFLNIWESEFNSVCEKYELVEKEAKEMIKNEKNYNKSEKQIEKIKNYAQTSLELYQMMKYFTLEKGRKKIEPENGSDAKFYNDFDKYYQDYNVFAYYNEFRNYLTKKDFLGRLLFPVFGDKKEQRHPLSKRRIDGAEKIKLNFGCGYLLGGWAQSYNKEYGALIFEKDKKYYLGIINGKGLTKDEKNDLYKDINPENAGKRLIYDFQKPDNKNTPRLFIRSKGNNFAPAVKKLNLPIKSILDIYDQGLFKVDKKNPEKHKPHLKKMIDYFKLGFTRHPSYKHYNFSWKNSDDYENIADFYRDTLDSCYKIDWEEVNFTALKNLEAKNRIYLFEIYNKDFGLAKKESAKNIYTTLFLELLKKENAKILRLMGGAEIFYRPAVLDENKQRENIIKTKKGRIIGIHKKDKPYHLKRYAKEKTFLHFPIQIIGRKLRRRNLNNEVLEFLERKESDINIIGIDRGENNLAYYSVITQKGEVLETGSLNNPLGNRDYNELLEEKAKNREEARKNWQTIENIKELKSGYISQVIRKICDLILKYNAIVVFEDLNIGFKRGRQKIEKSVYQKLELALAKKLNYFVNKYAKEGKAGHYLKAYQLTPLINTFSDIRKQCGIIFYTTAGYTSITCPQCGFRRNTRFVFENKEKAKEKIRHLGIYFEPEKNSFRIEYNLDNFQLNQEKKTGGENELFGDKTKKKHFIVYSDVKRIRWHSSDMKSAKAEHKGNEEIIRTSDRGYVKTYDINGCLKRLFKESGIEISKGDISEQLVKKDFNVEFYKQLFYYLDILLFIRSAISKDDNGPAIDLIQCPACHFNSENGFQGKGFNGDANGAYNIARKGILILEKIRRFRERKEESIKKYNGDLSKLQFKHLTVGIDEWDKFVQGKWNPVSKSQN